MAPRECGANVCQIPYTSTAVAVEGNQGSTHRFTVARRRAFRLFPSRAPQSASDERGNSGASDTDSATRERREAPGDCDPISESFLPGTDRAATGVESYYRQQTVRRTLRFRNSLLQ